MKTLPPLEFTLDGPGLTLGQIGAVLKHQQALKARRRAGAPAAALDERREARAPADPRVAVPADRQP